MRVRCCDGDAVIHMCLDGMGDVYHRIKIICNKNWRTIHRQGARKHHHSDTLGGIAHHDTRSMFIASSSSTFVALYTACTKHTQARVGSNPQYMLLYVRMDDQKCTLKT